MEALVLGLSVGLVCVASCGAVLVPWLAVQQRSIASTGWLLAQVLAGRLGGYLLFAVLAWAFGLLVVPSDLRSRALVFGLAHLALAGLLCWYIVATFGDRRRRIPLEAAASRRLSRRALRLGAARLGPAAVGFLTGINACPPFVAATVRAAELGNLPAALAFFATFFVGTSVWFLPLLAVGTARRLPQSRIVAQVAMGIVAASYGYTGAVTVGWRLLHG